MEKTISILGFNVFSDHLDQIILDQNQTKILNTISPNSYGISTKDFLFREALKKSDYLVLDGVYFALSSLLIQGENIKKNQGLDVFHHFMNRMNSTDGKVFFLGSSNETLNKIRINAASDYPNIRIECYSPPYQSEFSNEDTLKMTEAINTFAPEIIFIGMTCPKQEKWSYQNKEIINAKLICSIGAVFDWYAGNEKHIAQIWWKLRLGWLIRTIHRPEILKRFPNIGIFFFHLFLAIIGNKKYKYGKF